MTPTKIEIAGVETKIYLIRGEKVMLDYDLAELYQVPTKQLKQQVKRNAFRFPSDFMFILTDQEVTNLRSQIVTSNVGRGGRRTAPLAFTEQGVAMLSSILNSRRAVEVNIEIMRAFVSMRRVLNSDTEFGKRLRQLEIKFDGKFRIVFQAIQELMSERVVPRKRIIGLGKDEKP